MFRLVKKKDLWLVGGGEGEGAGGGGGGGGGGMQQQVQRLHRGLLSVLSDFQNGASMPVCRRLHVCKCQVY